MLKCSHLRTYGTVILYITLTLLVLHVKTSVECNGCIVAHMPSFDGVLIEDYQIWNTSAPRYDICYRFCYLNRKCLSFQFNSESQSCYLFASTFTSPGLVPESVDPGIKLYVTCRASGHLGDSCSVSSDCKQALTYCVDDLCQCSPGFDYSSESFDCGAGYVGCFGDNSTRILPHGHFSDATHQTNELCQTHCRDLGYRLAGTEIGQQCFCGNVVGDYPLFDDNRCNRPCPGNPSEMCGDTWKISVYNTGFQ